MSTRAFTVEPHCPDHEFDNHLGCERCDEARQAVVDRKGGWAAGIDTHRLHIDVAQPTGIDIDLSSHPVAVWTGSAIALVGLAGIIVGITIGRVFG